MTIGKLAKKADVSVETIRYYQRIQLLAEPPKPASGFRFYDQAALDKLSFIRKAKGLGFSLEDIRELWSLQQANEPCDNVCALARKNLALVRQRINELKILEERISKLVTGCGDNPDCLIIKTLSGRLVEGGEASPSVRARLSHCGSLGQA